MKVAAWRAGLNVHNDCCSEDELRATLQRGYAREGSISAAIRAWERDHGRPLSASAGLLLEIEAQGFAIDEAADAIYAIACPASESQVKRNGAR